MQAPGELGNFGQAWNPYPDNPVAFSKLQLKELKNGRLAMLAIMGELAALAFSWSQTGVVIAKIFLFAYVDLEVDFAWSKTSPDCRYGQHNAGLGCCSMCSVSVIIYTNIPIYFPSFGMPLVFGLGVPRVLTDLRTSSREP